MVLVLVLDVLSSSTSTSTANAEYEYETPGKISIETPKHANIATSSPLAFEVALFSFYRTRTQ